jgi:acyl carrier protein
LTEITTLDIQSLVEEAVDQPLAEFAMDANWYEAYGMDSLGAVALHVDVRKRYGIDIPVARMPEIRTGEQLAAVLQELLAAPAPQDAAAAVVAEAAVHE